MAKHHLHLQPSERVIVQATAEIYAAYISAGRVLEGEHEQWIERSLTEAIHIAKLADARIISDDEMDSSGGGLLGNAS
ncbi:MAG: hypothetical protein WBF93_06905 [Pirellulales bacterium]